MSEAEARANYRKEVLCLPGPIDKWISASVADNVGADSQCPLAPDEVRCTIQMQRVEASDEDGDFGDGDTFVLYLTIAGSSRSSAPHALESSNRIILEKYQGWNDSLDAPDWSKWTPGHTVVFRQSRAKLTKIMRAVLWEDEIASLADTLNSVHI